jgi:hypothetical protein
MTLIGNVITFLTRLGGIVNYVYKRSSCSITTMKWFQGAAGIWMWMWWVKYNNMQQRRQIDLLSSF